MGPLAAAPQLVGQGRDLVGGVGIGLRAGPPVMGQNQFMLADINDDKGDRLRYVYRVLTFVVRGRRDTPLSTGQDKDESMGRQA